MRYPTRRPLVERDGTRGTVGTPRRLELDARGVGLLERGGEERLDEALTGVPGGQQHGRVVEVLVAERRDLEARAHASRSQMSHCQSTRIPARS